MKNPYEVLGLKEEKAFQLRWETEALRFVIGLLDREDEEDASPANTPDGRPAIRCLTNSGRLEVVVGGAPRLRFAGRMCLPVEVMSIGNELHIFVPTPQPGSASSSQLKEEAA